MKNNRAYEKKRILGRALATELNDEELKKIAGGAIATNSISHGAWADEEDDCDQMPAY